MSATDTSALPDYAPVPRSALGPALEDNPPIDRTTTNAWEGADFLSAVRAVLTEPLLRA
jgi:hypothetical protein